MNLPKQLPSFCRRECKDFVLLQAYIHLFRLRAPARARARARINLSFPNSFILKLQGGINSEMSNKYGQGHGHGQGHVF